MGWNSGTNSSSSSSGSSIGTHKRHKCNKCNGSGQKLIPGFIFGPDVVSCYCCMGKGYHEERSCPVPSE